MLANTPVFEVDSPIYIYNLNPMSFSRLIAFMLSLTIPLHGGSLADLQVNFEVRCKFAAANRDEQLKKLDESYLAALDRQVEKIRHTGKLDAVIPFIDEAKAVKAAKYPLPDLPDDASPELKKMRLKHSDLRAKILKSHAEAITLLAEKMEAALIAKEQELTKAGKIDEALTAKQMRDSLSEDQGLDDAKNYLDANEAELNPGNWISLLDQEMKVLEQGLWQVARLSDADTDKKAFPQLVALLSQRRETPESLLMAIPNSKIEFNANRHFTQIRGSLLLSNATGTVRFRIRVGDEIVFDESLIKQNAEKKFDLTFKPTRRIILETDKIDKDAGDWSAWIKPEIR